MGQIHDPVQVHSVDFVQGVEATIIDDVNSLHQGWTFSLLKYTMYVPEMLFCKIVTNSR